MQIVERNKPGKGRRNRVGISLKTEYDNKLNKLAMSCGNMSKTTLAMLLVEYCLDDPAIVDLFQMDYNRLPEYWVFHVVDEKGKRNLVAKRLLEETKKQVAATRLYDYRERDYQRGYTDDYVALRDDFE